MYIRVVNFTGFSRSLPKNLSKAADKVSMSVSAIALAGLVQAQANFTQAAQRLSDPNVADDAVSLSSAAVALTQAHTGFSVGIKVLKAADEIEANAISLLGEVYPRQPMRGDL